MIDTLPAARTSSEVVATARKGPTVSVVTPTYNRAHLVGRAIRSVLAQTFEDWELVVVDDASTDDAEAVVRGFKDHRIRYLRHEINRGASAARNTGLKAARGQYVAFLDSDDEWLPEKLEAQVELFRANPRAFPALGVVLTGQSLVDSRTGRRFRAYIPPRRGKVYACLFAGGMKGDRTVLARRECLLEVGGFDENLPVSEVWDLCVRLAAKYEFEVVERILVLSYKNHGARLWTSDNVGRTRHLLLAKYDEGIPNRRRFRARLRLNAGSYLLRCGDSFAALKEFWGSMLLRPSVRCAGYLILGLLGRAPYHALSRAKRWCVTRLNIQER